MFQLPLGSNGARLLAGEVGNGNQFTSLEFGPFSSAVILGRCLDVGMSKNLRNSGNVCARIKQVACRGAAQVVPVAIRDACLCATLPKNLVESGCGDLMLRKDHAAFANHAKKRTCLHSPQCQPVLQSTESVASGVNGALLVALANDANGNGLAL